MPILAPIFLKNQVSHAEPPLENERGKKKKEGGKGVLAMKNCLWDVSDTNTNVI